MASVDAFTLRIAFGEDAYAPSPTYHTVPAGYVRRVSTQSCRRTRFQDAFSAGSASFTLDMSDRVYDPSYSGSAHAGGFLYGVPIDISAGGTTLWSGYVRRWQPAITAHDATLTIIADDALGEFANTTLATVAETDDQQSIDNRLGDVLDQLNWPTGDRTLDPATIPLAATTYGQGGLQALITTARSDPGFVYFDPFDGHVHFEHRHAVQTRSRMATSQRTFGTGGTGIVDGTLTLAAVGDTFRNISRITDADGTEWTAGTLTSTQIERAIARIIEPATVTGHGQVVADYLLDLYDTSATSPNGWTVDVYLGDTDVAETAVAATRLRDRVTVAYDPPGTGTESVEVLVTGIEHTATPERWRTRYTAEPVAPYDALTGAGDWLVLGTGLLGTNRLGY